MRTIIKKVLLILSLFLAGLTFSFFGKPNKEFIYHNEEQIHYYKDDMNKTKFTITTRFGEEKNFQLYKVELSEAVEKAINEGDQKQIQENFYKSSADINLCDIDQIFSENGVHFFKCKDQSFYAVIKYDGKFYFKHFSEKLFNSIQNEKISKIVATKSDLPIAFKVEENKKSSKVYCFSPSLVANTMTVSTNPACLTNKGQNSNTSGILQEGKFFSFKGAVFPTADQSTFVTYSASNDWKNQSDQMRVVRPTISKNNKDPRELYLVTTGDLVVEPIANDMKILTNKGLHGLRSYGMFGVNFVTKLLCKVCDTISRYVPGILGLIVYITFVNLLILPSIFIDAQNSIKNKNLLLQKSFINNTEADAMNLQKQQMPSFTRMIVAFIFEMIITYQSVFTVIFYCYRFRSLKFFYWIKNFFAVEPYTVFNFYGVFKFFNPQFLPSFLKNVGVILIISVFLLWLEINKNTKKSDYLFSYGSAVALLFMLYDKPVIQLITIALIRLPRNLIKMLIEKYLSSRQIQEIKK